MKRYLMGRDCLVQGFVLGVFMMLAGVTQAYVLGPTTPGKWGSPIMGTGATITWSLMDTGVLCGSHCTGSNTSLADFMPANFKDQLQLAFDAWSSVANLTFVEVADTGGTIGTSGQLGDIRIGGHTFDGTYGVLAHGYYPLNNGSSFAGDIHFDTAETWVDTFVGGGFSIFQVFAHELGHALGLDHTAVAGSLMNPSYSEAFVGPQADDIAGMQYIYGIAPTAVPAPDTLILLLSGLLGFIKFKRV